MKLFASLLLLLLTSTLAFASFYNCSDFLTDYSSVKTIVAGDIVSCSGQTLQLFSSSNPSEQVSELRVKGTLILDNHSTLLFGPGNGLLNITANFSMWDSTISQEEFGGTRYYYSIIANGDSTLNISDSTIEYLSDLGFSIKSSVDFYNLDVVNSEGGLIVDGVDVALNASNVSSIEVIDGSASVIDSAIPGFLRLDNSSAQLSDIPFLNLTMLDSLASVNHATSFYGDLVDSTLYLKNSGLQGISADNSTYSWMWSLWATLVNPKGVLLDSVKAVAFDRDGNFSNSSQQVFEGLTNSTGQLEIPLAQVVYNGTTVPANVTYPSNYTVIFSKDGYESFNISYESIAEQSIMFEMETLKGIVPMGGDCDIGANFCASLNPITRANSVCLKNMRAGDSCQVMFTVNATDNDYLVEQANVLINKTFGFFVIASSNFGASKVASATSASHNITIVS